MQPLNENEIVIDEQTANLLDFLAKHRGTDLSEVFKLIGGTPESFRAFLSEIGYNNDPEAKVILKLLEMRSTTSGYLGSGTISPLTPRQQELAALVAQGLTNREISQELGISVFTVRQHISNIITRLGLRSRTQISFLVGQNQNTRREERRPS
jgi:DNA-binding CsgD family transcriptional regulator